MPTLLKVIVCFALFASFAQPSLGALARALQATSPKSVATSPLEEALVTALAKKTVKLDGVTVMSMDPASSKVTLIVNGKSKNYSYFSAGGMTPMTVMVNSGGVTSVSFLPVTKGLTPTASLESWMMRVRRESIMTECHLCNLPELNKGEGRIKFAKQAPPEAPGKQEKKGLLGRAFGKGDAKVEEGSRSHLDQYGIAGGVGGQDGSSFYDMVPGEL